MPLLLQIYFDRIERYRYLILLNVGLHPALISFVFLILDLSKHRTFGFPIKINSLTAVTVSQ